MKEDAPAPEKPYVPEKFPEKHWWRRPIEVREIRRKSRPVETGRGPITDDADPDQISPSMNGSPHLSPIHEAILPPKVNIYYLRIKIGQE